MIVTRRRRKVLPWQRILWTLAALAVAAAALLLWPPSHDWIFRGPLPQAARVRTLNRRLAVATARLARRDKQISSLQTQINQIEQQLARANGAGLRKPVPFARPQVATAFGSTSGSNLAASATPDMRRTGEYWAAMDPGAAAKIVQRLPVEYVARVFAVMPSDAVGAILEDLPPAFAAGLTQERPTLRR